MGRAFGQPRQMRAQRQARGSIVPAIQPKLHAGRGLCQRPTAQPLHTGGPENVFHGGATGVFSGPKVAQRRKCRAGILHLVRPRQARHRQIQKPALVLKHQPPAFLMHMPMLPMGHHRYAQPRRLPLDHVKRLVRLRPYHTWHAALQDPGLLKGNLAQRVAQILLVIDRHRRDHRQRRAVDHIGRVQPPAQPDLQQGVIRRAAGKGQKRGAGRDLEIGDVRALVGAIARVQHRTQMVFGNQLSGQPDPLVKPRQMRAGIGVHHLAHRLQPGPDHRLGRSLAVGSGQMDHRRQVAFRMVQRRQQPPHPVQRQVDDLGMQRHHPLQDDIRRRRRHAVSGAVLSSPPSSGASCGASTASGAGRSPATAGGRPSNIRVMVINSSRSAVRGVTRSSIP